MQTDPSVSHAANPSFARPATTGYDRTPVGVHGHTGAASAPGAAHVDPTRVAKPSRGTTFTTGAYQPSGEPMIDRMISLERALKTFGNVV